MKLYDGYIARIKELCGGFSDAKTPYGKPKLKCADKNDVLFLKDAAYELGGSQQKCVSTLAVTDGMKFDNVTRLIGRDITEISSDCPFAKIVLLEIGNIDDDNAFDAIKSLEHLRYRVCPEGFMARASALNMREQIRVSKKAVKKKLTFADYGNALIAEYLKMPNVKSVEIIVITDPSFDYGALGEVAEKIKETTSALNHIFDNILFDCKNCNLKEICDKVEGMKELHMKQAAK